MNSTIKHGYDALLALRSADDRATALTADGANTLLVDLHRLTAGRGDLKNQYGQTPFDVVISVGAVTGTAQIIVETVDAAGANAVAAPGGTVTAVAGQTLVLKFDPATLAAADADAAFLRVSHNVEAASSVAYYAFAAPNSNA